MIKWCHNSKTGEIFDYNQEEELTDFPRGVFLAYGDYLTTGFNNKKEAEEWAKEYKPCHKCRSSRKSNEAGNCRFCGSNLIGEIGGYNGEGIA